MLNAACPVSKLAVSCGKRLGVAMHVLFESTGDTHARPRPEVHSAALCKQCAILKRFADAYGSCLTAC